MICNHGVKLWGFLDKFLDKKTFFLIKYNLPKNLLYFFSIRCGNLKKTYEIVYKNESWVYYRVI